MLIHPSHHGSSRRLARVRRLPRAVGTPVSHWNYRVTRTRGQEGVQVREVFYEDGFVVAWTQDPVAPFGEDVDEFAADLRLMGRAVAAPVLVLDESGDEVVAVTGGRRGRRGRMVRRPVNRVGGAGRG